MRVAQYYSNSDIRLEEMPQPSIGPEEILMRVEASGICGSDVMEWYRSKVPVVLGHETAGIVAAVGPRVKGFRRGDRIVATHHVPCLKCEYCRNGHETVCETLRTTKFYPGGFSEFLRLPAINVRLGTLKIPARVSFEEATFVEPLGCVIRGQRLSGMKKGRRVLVVGSGIAGLLHVKLAKHLGAKTIVATDIDPWRLKMAKRFGAVPVDAREDVPARVMQANKGKLADLVILCASADGAIRQGLESVERGGRVLIFTAAKKDALLPVPVNDLFWRTEVSVVSCYAASPSDLKEALTLIAKRKVSVGDMITHRLPLADIQKGFAMVVNPKDSVKVIIQPQR